MIPNSHRFAVIKMPDINKAEVGVAGAAQLRLLGMVSMSRERLQCGRAYVWLRELMGRGLVWAGGDGIRSVGQRQVEGGL